MNSNNNIDSFPKIPREEFVSRINSLKEAMRAENLDLIILYSNYIDPTSVRYFSDFFPVNENGAMAIPLKGDPILCSGQANHNWSKFKSDIKDVRILPEVGEVSGVEYDLKVFDFNDLFIELKDRFSISRIGYYGELTFPHVIFSKMQNAFRNCEIINVDNLISDLRMSKSENELKCIRKAGEIIDKCYEFAIPRIKSGVTELDIHADIQSQMLRLGAEDHCLSWAPMIPSGKENTNLCMFRNTLRKIQESEIIYVDAGTLYEGYNAVISTPMVLGDVPDEIKKAISVAWDAEKLMMESLKPGISSKELVKTYSDFLDSKGYLKYSPYGAVHSLGMLECESPFFSKKRDVYLKDNSVVAVDVYFDGLPWGSFRLQDTFIVGKHGSEIVTKFNQEYLKRFL